MTGGASVVDRICVHTEGTMRRMHPFHAHCREALAGIEAQGRYRRFTPLRKQADAVSAVPSAGRQRGAGLVVQRLSRHGRPSRGGRGRLRGRPRDGRRRGRHAQHQRHQPGARCAGGGTGRSARQAGGAAVHLGLRVQPGGALHHPELAARLAGVFRRAEPRLDDRRDQGIAGDLPHLPPQRPGASRGPAARGAGGRAEADRVRVGVLDGRRHRPDRRDLRSGRAPRRDDLPR